MEFHLRITVKYENAKHILDKFVATFKPVEYISGYENGDFRFDQNMPEVNPHCHAYLKYDKVPTKQKISSFFKLQSLERKSECMAGYYHRLQNTSREQNIVYSIKKNIF